MDLTDPDMTALIGSRICHDLISPLGAISNGVELLQLDPGNDGPEMALISESVRTATDRIKFFRVAFGAANGSQTLGAAEMTSLLRGLGGSEKTTIDWQPATELPRSEAKLLLLLLQCLGHATPWGGHISVAAEDTGWRLAAVADRLRVEPELWNLLGGAASVGKAEAAEVEFLLAPAWAAALGRRLAVGLSETRIDIHA